MDTATPDLQKLNPIHLYIFIETTYIKTNRME